MVLVLEAGFEVGVDLQGVVVGCQLERQGGVTLFLKTPVGIQYLHVWMDKHEKKVQEIQHCHYDILNIHFMLAAREKNVTNALNTLVSL